MAEQNSIAPRCCGVVGLFTSLPSTGKRGGARPGAGGPRPGAGRKPSVETLFARAFVGPPVPKQCSKCGENFYGRGAKCKNHPTWRRPDACPHERPIFKNGKKRKACYVCAPKKSKGGDRAPTRKLSTVVAPCAECGKECERWVLAKYCSGPCKLAGTAKQQSLAGARRRDLRNSVRELRVCVVCGSDFREGLRTLCCSEACSAEHERGRKSGHTHARRAKRFGCTYESVDKQRVFDRDKWRCQICGVKVDGKTAELDHIVPMSMGGAHSYANTQCACMPCNRKKGAKPLGQLHLGIAA